METYAERFTTIEQARLRWQELERRLLINPAVDGLVVSSYLDGVPHVLFVADKLPSGLIAEPQGQIVSDIHWSVWQRLWERHERGRVPGKAHHKVTRRDPSKGERVEW